MVWSLALRPDDAKQDPVVYGAKFGVVFLAEDPRTASILYIIIYLFYYVLKMFCFIFARCPCMAINNQCKCTDQRWVSPRYYVVDVILLYRRYFQHAHFIPIVGVGKRRILIGPW